MTAGPPPAPPPPPGPPGPAPAVQPQPSPFSWNWGDIRDSQQNLLGQVLVLHTLLGPLRFFFGTDELAAFTEQAEERLAQCRGGLIRATEIPQRLPPDLRGNGNRIQ
jgi:hypothetical protein